MILIDPSGCKLPSEEDLYKNVLPYIKQVANDAARTKQLILAKSKQAKPAPTKIIKPEPQKKTNQTAMLKELDNKVLPWLDELTAKVNSIADGNASLLKAQLKKVQHQVKGPSALNSDQDFQLGNEEVAGQREQQLHGTIQNHHLLANETQQQKQDPQLKKTSTPDLHEFEEYKQVVYQTPPASLNEQEDKGN